jgi:Family of unknown function (DUF6151)
VTDLAIRCSCGTFRGRAREVSPAAGNHVVCYCDDCQAFAHFLGRPREILDAQGGTEIFQMSAARFSIDAGAERLACMRLSPRGMCRWYASCCNTPIGNTLPKPSIPFVGLIGQCFVRPADDSALETTLGPIRARAFGKFAQGGVAAVPKGGSLAAAVVRFLALALKWRLRGDQRRSAFFVPATEVLIVTPRVLTLAERDALRAQVREGC